MSATDELRELAGRMDGLVLDTPDMLRDAADTIDELRELVRDMLMCLTWANEPHGYLEDGCNCCRYRGKTHGMCGLGMFKGRSIELGIGVDGE